MRRSLKLNLNWELLIDLHQLQKDKLDINTNVNQFYKLLVMNLLRSKMLVSNELSKGFQIKSAVIKYVILTEKYLYFNKRNSKENWREIKCFSCLYFFCEYLLIYHLNKQENL